MESPLRDDVPIALRPFVESPMQEDAAAMLLSEARESLHPDLLRLNEASGSQLQQQQQRLAACLPASSSPGRSIAALA